MQNTINIDASSFFRSNFTELSYTISTLSEDEDVNSTLSSSHSESTDIRKAIKEHLSNITESIEGELSDYETTVSFDRETSDLQKAEFTDIFNEFNTRDESY